MTTPTSTVSCDLQTMSPLLTTEMLKKSTLLEQSNDPLFQMSPLTFGSYPTKSVSLYNDAEQSYEHAEEKDLTTQSSDAYVFDPDLLVYNNHLCEETEQRKHFLVSDITIPYCHAYFKEDSSITELSATLCLTDSYSSPKKKDLNHLPLVYPTDITVIKKNLDVMNDRQDYSIPLEIMNSIEKMNPCISTNQLRYYPNALCTTSFDYPTSKSVQQSLILDDEDEDANEFSMSKELLTTHLEKYSTEYPLFSNRRSSNSVLSLHHQHAYHTESVHDEDHITDVFQTNSPDHHTVLNDDLLKFVLQLTDSPQSEITPFHSNDILCHVSYDSQKKYLTTEPTTFIHLKPSDHMYTNDKDIMKVVGRHHKDTPFTTLESSISTYDDESVLNGIGQQRSVTSESYYTANDQASYYTQPTCHHYIPYLNMTKDNVLVDNDQYLESISPCPFSIDSTGSHLSSQPDSVSSSSIVSINGTIQSNVSHDDDSDLSCDVFQSNSQSDKLCSSLTTTTTTTTNKHDIIDQHVVPYSIHHRHLYKPHDIYPLSSVQKIVPLETKDTTITSDVYSNQPTVLSTTNPFLMTHHSFNFCKDVDRHQLDQKMTLYHDSLDQEEKQQQQHMGQVYSSTEKKKKKFQESLFHSLQLTQSQTDLKETVFTDTTVYDYSSQQPSSLYHCNKETISHSITSPGIHSSSYPIQSNISCPISTLHDLTHYGSHVSTPSFNEKQLLCHETRKDIDSNPRMIAGNYCSNNKQSDHHWDTDQSLSVSRDNTSHQWNNNNNNNNNNYHNTSFIPRGLTDFYSLAYASKRWQNLNVVLPLFIPHGVVAVIRSTGENTYVFSDQYPASQLLFSGAGKICDMWSTYLRLRVAVIHKCPEFLVPRVAQVFNSALAQLPKFGEPIRLRCAGMVKHTIQLRSSGGLTYRYDTIGQISEAADQEKMRILFDSLQGVLTEVNNNLAREVEEILCSLQECYPRIIDEDNNDHGYNLSNSSHGNNNGNQHRVSGNGAPIPTKCGLEFRFSPCKELKIAIREGTLCDCPGVDSVIAGGGATSMSSWAQQFVVESLIVGEVRLERDKTSETQLDPFFLPEYEIKTRMISKDINNIPARVCFVDESVYPRLYRPAVEYILDATPIQAAEQLCGATHEGLAAMLPHGLGSLISSHPNHSSHYIHPIESQSSLSLTSSENSSSLSHSIYDSHHPLHSQHRQGYFQSIHTTRSPTDVTTYPQTNFTVPLSTREQSQSIHSWQQTPQYQTPQYGLPLHASPSMTVSHAAYCPPTIYSQQEIIPSHSTLHESTQQLSKAIDDIRQDTHTHDITGGALKSLAVLQKMLSQLNLDVSHIDKSPQRHLCNDSDQLLHHPPYHPPRPQLTKQSKVLSDTSLSKDNGMDLQHHKKKEGYQLNEQSSDIPIYHVESTNNNVTVLPKEGSTMQHHSTDIRLTPTVNASQILSQLQSVLETIPLISQQQLNKKNDQTIIDTQSPQTSIMCNTLYDKSSSDTLCHHSTHNVCHCHHVACLSRCMSTNQEQQHLKKQSVFYGTPNEQHTQQKEHIMISHELTDRNPISHTSLTTSSDHELNHCLDIRESKSLGSTPAHHRTISHCHIKQMNLTAQHVFNNNNNTCLQDTDQIDSDYLSYHPFENNVDTTTTTGGGTAIVPIPETTSTTEASDSTVCPISTIGGCPVLINSDENDHCLLMSTSSETFNKQHITADIFEDIIQSTTIIKEKDSYNAS